MLSIYFGLKFPDNFAKIFCSIQQLLWGWRVFGQRRPGPDCPGAGSPMNLCLDEYQTTKERKKNTKQDEKRGF